jgi:hypothetical protein
MLEAGVRADPQSATVGAPASMTLGRGPLTDAARPLPSRGAGVIVTVSGYQPPAEGAVQIVVKAKVMETGDEREIGRFGVMPRTAFSSGQPDKTQRFRLSLPPDLPLEKIEKLKVYLVPSTGDGAGARVEIGNATVE